MRGSIIGAAVLFLSLWTGALAYGPGSGNKPGQGGYGDWHEVWGDGPTTPGQVIDLPGGQHYTVPAPKDYLNDPKAYKEALNGLDSPEVRKHAEQYCKQFPNDCNAYLSAMVAFDKLESGPGGMPRQPPWEAIAYLRQISNPELRQFVRQDAKEERQWEVLHAASEQFIAANPKKPEGYLGAADAAMGMGKPKDAIRYLETALEMDPQNPELYSKLAQAQYKAGDMKGAFESGKQAMQLGARDEGTLTLTKAAQGQLERGGAAPAADPAGGPGADSAAPVDPRFFSGPGPGAGQIAAGQFQASERLYKSAQGKLLQRDFPGAVDAASKALQYNDKNAAALYTRSLAFMHMGRNQQALQDIDAALALAPRNDTLLLAKSSILNRMGQYSEALSIARQVAAMKPESAEAYHNMAWAFAGLGNRADAVSALQRAASLDPRFQQLYQQALQLPRDADLAALFLGGPGGDSAPRPAKRESGGSGSPMLVWVGTILGGLLVALLAVFALTREGAGRIKRATRSLGWTSPRVGEAATPEGGAPTLAGVGEGGDVIGGAFRILRQIGAGGMGVVHEAVDISLERHVAVKKMREEIRSDPRERERFLREAKTVAALHHPNIVEIYRIVEEGLDVYLVFEFVQGRTVTELVRARKAMPFREAVAVLRGICAALEFAHKRNVIHRDLKPSNVMVDSDGVVKVMDFGVARITQDSLSRLCMTNTVVGTPPYMAPEQEQGMVRRESDLYALAVCFYEMVTGQLPFNGVGAGMLMAKINKTYVPPSRVTAGLPAGLDAWMDKALDPEPDKRWRTAAEFLETLEAVS